MNHPQPPDLIDALVHARRSGKPVSTDAFANTLADQAQAYAVQSAVAHSLGWFPDDAAPRHWKSGGASRDGELTHAPLPPAGIWTSPACPPAGFAMRLHCVEAEVALRLAQDVDREAAAALDLAFARRLIDAMTVSIEVVDSRWAEGLDAPALLRLADQQSHGALVLGDWIAFDPLRDWSAQRCTVRIGDSAPHAFRGTHSLADPAFVLPQWLRHATRDGAVVRAASVVTTGTWCGVLEARAGDEVVVAFDGVARSRIRFPA